MKQDYIIDRFDGGQNNVSNARDLANNEAVYLEGLVPDIPGQLRTMGKEASQGKTFTGFQTVNGSGLFHTLVDRNRAGNEYETEWLLSPDKDTGIVSVLEYGSIGGEPSAGTWSNALSPTMDIGTTNCKGVFHSYDGVIRGCDGNFGGTPKGYGYIKRNRWSGSSSPLSINGWKSESLLLTPPSQVLFLDDTDSLVTTYSDFRIQIKLIMENSLTNVNYLWHKEFECAVSYVYDNNQESLLTVNDDPIDNAAITDGSRGTFQFCIGGSNVADWTALNPRITHAKLYIREVGTDDWYLQAVYDFDKGGSLPYSDWAAAWTLANFYHTRNVSSVTLNPMPDPLIEHTYISETGHSPSEKAIDIGNGGDGWKASAIMNRQVYLFGVRAKNKDGEQLKQGDMILVSEPGQPDKFLRDNALISTTGDGDHLVYGLAVDDRLFAFKRKSMRIINVAQETFVEETIKEGVDDVDKAVLTDYGVAWVNKNGLFLYGRKFVELFKKRIEGRQEPFIDLDWFNTNIYASGNCGLAYNKYKQQLIISGYANGKLIIYDFASGSVSYGESRIATLSSNFVEDVVGNTLFLVGSGANVLLYKFDFDETEYINPKYWTKDIDFGAPGVKKYIYGVKISYTHSHATALDDNVEMVIDGGTTYRLVGRMLGSQTTFVEATYIMPSSAVYQECKSAQLKIGGYDWVGSEAEKNTKLRINHIIINNRILPNAR